MFLHLLSFQKDFIRRALIGEHLFIPAVPTIVFFLALFFFPFCLWLELLTVSHLLLLSSLEFVLYVNNPKLHTQLALYKIVGLGAICEAWFLHLICFLFLRPWQLRLNLRHCRSFISLSLLWTVLPTLGGRMFFLSMNVNHPAWPAKAVSAVTDAAFTDLSFIMAPDRSLTEEDVCDPTSVGVFG